MHRMWYTISLIIIVLFLFAGAAPSISTGSNSLVVSGQQNREELHRLFAMLQHQLEEENETRNLIDSSHRAQLGMMKTRRAPSDDSYEWEGMIQALDNLRKPRFGRR